MLKGEMMHFSQIIATSNFTLFTHFQLAPPHTLSYLLLEVWEPVGHSLLSFGPLGLLDFATQPACQELKVQLDIRSAPLDSALACGSCVGL